MTDTVDEPFDPTDIDAPVEDVSEDTRAEPVPKFANDEERRMYALDVAGRIPQNGIESYLEAADKIVEYIKTGTKSV